MSVLVTGGLGFIGSHTVVELVSSGEDVIIVDDFSNSNINVLHRIKQLCNEKHNKIQFIQENILNKYSIEQIFKSNVIKTVIHFAAFKSVKESIENPLEYYENNVGGTMNILQFCNKYNVTRFIFSSSATVYGSSVSPLYETSQVGVGITNPYGQSKLICERIIQDFSKVSTTECVLLRYFNPVGAHSSGLIGEDPEGVPNNLMPFVLRVGKRNNLDPSMDDIYTTLSIMGNDYSTLDGTAVRDFIHVVDLANAHVAACNYDVTDKCDVFNIGTGIGTSVLEIVDAFQNINQIYIPYKFTDRRDGDLENVHCNCDKAKHVLKWTANHSIEDIVRDSWNFIIH